MGWREGTMKNAKKIVVVGFMGRGLYALPSSLEAQRVVVRAKAPAVRVNVRLGPPVRFHTHKVSVHPVRTVKPAALRCDLREDVRDAREDRRDLAEDIADRREDRRDAQHNGGLRDRLEDVQDRAEDRRDRKEDVRDAREDRWDATHIGCRR
jgi:hypothetical protein